MLIYHGTKEKNALSKMKNGFDFSRAGENWGITYGKGIYFTPNYETAKFYAGEDGIILSFNLDINPYKLKKDRSPNGKLREKIPIDADSIINPNEDEIVIINRKKVKKQSKKTK